MKETIKQLQSYVPEEPIAKVKQRYGLDRIVRLSANENPYGTSPKVVKALQGFDFTQENFYPDGYAQRLRTKVAQRLQVPEDQLVFGVGLDEIIAYLSRVFLERGDEVITPQPTFSEYALNAKIEGAKVVDVPLTDGGGIDFNAILAQINQRTKLIWLCNPNNPTGTYANVSQIHDFMTRVPQQTVVLIDEAYIQYVTDVDQPSALPLVNEFPNIGIMRTFSKVYGIANMRIGFIVLPPKLAGYLQTIRLPYNLNSLSQRAAEAALDDQAFVTQAVQKNAVERAKWEQFFQTMGLKSFHSQANFVYFYVDDPNALADELLKNGFQVRRGLEPTALRITVGKANDNQRMQDLIANFLK